MNSSSALIQCYGIEVIQQRKLSSTECTHLYNHIEPNLIIFNKGRKISDYPQVMTFEPYVDHPHCTLHRELELVKNTPTVCSVRGI